MRRVRIVRAHRSDSWTAKWIGEIVWVETAEPHVETAAVYGAPWSATEVLGWDVAMDRLTSDQAAKFHEQTDDLMIGTLFLPEECCEIVD